MSDFHDHDRYAYRRDESRDYYPRNRDYGSRRRSEPSGSDMRIINAVIGILFAAAVVLATMILMFFLRRMDAPPDDFFDAGASLPSNITVDPGQNAHKKLLAEIIWYAVIYAFFLVSAMVLHIKHGATVLMLFSVWIVCNVVCTAVVNVCRHYIS